MWFVYYEVISFIVCYVLSKIISITIIKKLRTELNLTKKQLYFELSSAEIKNIIIYLIPVLNVIIALVNLLFYRRNYKDLKLSLELVIKKEKV